MPISEDATSPGWRVTVLTQKRRTGQPPYYTPIAKGQPLARRGDLRIHAQVGGVNCVDGDGRIRWVSPCTGIPNAAHISSGRVLVTTDSQEYTPWGFLGPALLLDLADGTLIAELRGERGAVLRGGRFFLGLAGYDFFDTWEYDRDGNQVDAWRSCGHFVAGSGIRVVESDRGLAEGSRVVRLRPGGVIERGPRLTGLTASEPLVLPDGTILLLDAGVLRAVGRGLEETVLAELLPVAPDELHRYLGTLERTADGLTVTLAEQHPEKHSRYTVHTWTLALRQL
ncbi:hypothetical protein F4556_006987 [Kitasatospora gansuensis]|uniref:Uncharacterized protein n=1 Tax=Kitasatospora gansuensis TaxID=258050 RepID=A0A7W7SJE1_9ACTN|nr:hypothetical protein [Kitasatospora gansuensis]MBB4951452.1 hypothetical protein [Kitasatospora gansuensis]